MYLSLCPLLDINGSVICLLTIDPSKLPPHHFINNADVALDNLDDLVADIVGVVGHGNAVVAVAGHADSEVHALQEALLINAAEDEAGLVEGFGTFCAGADAHGGDGFADGGVEAALLGEGAAVAYYAEGIHLQTVVVVEAEGLLYLHARIQLKAAGFEAVAAAGMATVEDGHVVLLGHPVDGGEETEEILLGVDVLFTVGREENVFALLQAQSLMHIACFYFCEVLVQDFGHGRAGDVGALTGQAALGEVAAGMLAVCHVDVGDDVDDAAVGLLGQALVLAAVAGFHVEDGDVQALGTYY